MNKVILIEDRPGRQAQLLGYKITQLENISFLTVPQESDCRKWIDNISSGDLSHLDEYSLIIIHKSSINGNGLRALQDHCASKKCDIILFSGGISQLLYFNGKYQSLALSSKDLYNPYLDEFLQKYSKDRTISLLELVYRSKWKLESLLRYRTIQTKLSYETDEETKILLEEELKRIETSVKIDVKAINTKIEEIISAL